MDADWAWNEWVTRHGAACLLLARQITRSEADAHDALQEGFVRFWRERERARDAWSLLYTCVRSAALDLLRGKKRRELREQYVGEQRGMFATTDVEAGQRAKAVEAALGELPQAQREVVVMKIWAGLTFGQIAQAIGESTNTVASRYRYGLEKLSAILSPEVRYE